MKKTKNDDLSLVKLYFSEKAQIYKKLDFKKILDLVNQIHSTYKKDGTIFIMGNGGSSGIAEGFSVDIRTHPFVSEDKNKTTKTRRPRVICLTESAGALTGISNDIGFGFVFSEQLKNFMRSKIINKNDLLIAFSSSGNSQNMIEAINYVKKYNVRTSCVSGRGGGKASKIVDFPIIIPGKPSSFPGQTGKNDNNFHIEDIQNAISHVITGLLKKFVNKK
jgi:D-sedoheptulose 7-phosphate isomerase